MLQGMGGAPGTPTSSAARTFFSPDGFWWWDGSAWKPALSEDRLWRWNGQAWEASRLPQASSSGAGAGAAIGITVVVAFVLILVLVSSIVIVVLLTMGGQIANVFSNVAAALNGP
jgi:Flp pilus assembly pilin Flp